MKYGVVQTSALVADLARWDALYCAGRLHKPGVPAAVATASASGSGIIGGPPESTFAARIRSCRLLDKLSLRGAGGRGVQVASSLGESSARAGRRVGVGCDHYEG